MADSVKIITPSISVDRPLGVGQEKKRRERDSLPKEPAPKEPAPAPEGQEEEEKDKGAKVNIKI